jgi:hypothetical protein
MFFAITLYYKEFESWRLPNFCYFPDTWQELCSITLDKQVNEEMTRYVGNQELKKEKEGQLGGQ